LWDEFGAGSQETLPFFPWQHGRQITSGGFFFPLRQTNCRHRTHVGLSSHRHSS
jgi:hypothetical protein